MATSHRNSGMDAQKFGVRGVMLLTAAAAAIIFFLHEGLRYDSWLLGYGVVFAAICSVMLLLYLGSRFSRRPGALRRIVYAVIALIPLAIWLLFPPVR
jgi:hypothetical protein